MAKGYNEVIAKCPFYRSDRPFVIVCEGPKDDAVTAHRFKVKKSYIGYLRKFCGGDYKSCPYYKILEAKYENS